MGGMPQTDTFWLVATDWRPPLEHSSRPCPLRSVNPRHSFAAAQTRAQQRNWKPANTLHNSGTRMVSCTVAAFPAEGLSFCPLPQAAVLSQGTFLPGQVWHLDFCFCSDCERNLKSSRMSVNQNKSVALQSPVLPKLSALDIDPLAAQVSQPAHKPVRNLSSRSVLKTCGFSELKQY